MSVIENLSQDPIMKKLIEKYGELVLSESKDHFVHLAGSIVSQQLSGKAADTIFKRVTALAGGEMTAEKMLGFPSESLRAAGVSGNKIKYIKNIAQAVADKSLDLENLNAYSDEDVIKQLTVIKGVGKWTAEMFLIFSLARPDVFSSGDGGLNSAIKRLYGGGAYLSKEMVAAITDKWKPYRSIASLYLWRSLEN